MFYHSSPITQNKKTSIPVSVNSVTDPTGRDYLVTPNRKPNCFTTSAGGRRFFPCLATSPSNENDTAQPMRSTVT